VRTYRNLMTTMLLGGLWHGANWTFVVWGGIHGLALSVERYFGTVFALDERPAPPLWSPRAWLARIVLFHLVCVAWVFFRAPGLGEAVAFLRGLGTLTWTAAYGCALGAQSRQPDRAAHGRRVSACPDDGRRRLRPQPRAVRRQLAARGGRPVRSRARGAGGAVGRAAVRRRADVLLRLVLRAEPPVSRRRAPRLGD